MKIKVIGCGGIGSSIVPDLLRFLNFKTGTEFRVTLIDGDTFEEGNKSRQAFKTFGNKAEVLVSEYSPFFDKLEIAAEGVYVTEKNIDYLIEEGDIVFVCVDNHKTRKLISEHAATLDDVVVLSGGNEYSDGNIQVFLRKSGESVTLSLDNAYHPEIANPKDRSPHEIGCDEEVASEPQLLFVNRFIGTLLLNAFYNYLEKETIEYDEVYANVLTNETRPVNRRRFL